MNYKTLTFLVKKFGAYQNNTRGKSKYLTNITFNGKLIPKENYNKYWKNEIDYFIGDSKKLLKQKWWKKDQDLLIQYEHLYYDYQTIIENIKKRSRHLTMTNDLTCISSISFYIWKDTLSMYVIQRSADISLGLKYDYKQMEYLLRITAHKTNMKVGKLTYKIMNAHIYLNNINKKKGFILN